MKLKKEIQTLRELGIPEYQIVYLIREKYKQSLSKKWR